MAGFVFFALALVSTDNELLERALFFEGEGEFLTVDGRETILSAINAPVGVFDWTIVGSIYDPKTEMDSMAWWEPIDKDISNWELKEPPKPSQIAQRFLALDTIPSLQVAVGSRGSGMYQKAAAWYRTELGDWKQASSENLGSAQEFIKVDLSPSGTAIAISRELQNGQEVYQIWLSSDSMNYQKVWPSPLETSPLENPLENPLKNIVLTDVSANADGFVAVGFLNRPDGLLEGVVWVSEDGLQWRQAKLDNFASAESTVLSGVESNAQGYIAVGGFQKAGVFSPMAWVSRDMDTWRNEGVFFDEGLDDTRLSTAGQFVGGVSESPIGFVSFSNVAFLQQVWRSVDGGAWREVGHIRGHRTSGVPVTDVALFSTGGATPGSNEMELVAIASDIGIWTFKPSIGWSELIFGIEGPEVLPRIEDGPAVLDIVWDEAEERFVAVGLFTHAQGERSNITSGGRIWASTDLGRRWDFKDQFHERDLGGPIFDIDSGPSGLGVVGVQDSILVAEHAVANPAQQLDPNPRGLFWSLDQGVWSQFKANPSLESYPNAEELIADVDYIFPSNSLLAVTSTNEGFIVGGWSFYRGYSDDNVDGFLLLVKNSAASNSAASDAPVFELVLPENVGLATPDFDDFVTALCSKEDGPNPESGTSVVFGINTREEGSKISAAVTFDGGQTWSISPGKQGSFTGLASQQVTACVSVPGEVCMNPGTIFADLAACESGDDFFVAVGETFVEGEQNAIAWWSATGQSWELLDLPPQLTASGNQAFTSVVASADGIVLISNDNSSGLERGQLWVEVNGSLELRSPGLEDDNTAITFTSAAINPEGYMVIAGFKGSRVPKIWYSQSPFFDG